MDLRDAAMLGMTQGADGGDDIQAKLVLGQDDAALLLGADRDAESGTIGVATASNLEGEADQTLHGSDGAACFISGPEWRSARRAGASQGGQFEDTVRGGSLCTSRHRQTPGR